MLQCHDQGDRHKELGAGRNTQHEWTCKRIVEKCLQQIAGYGQSAAQNHSAQKPWQTQVKKNRGRGCISLSAQRVKNLRQGKRHAPRHQIRRCENQNQKDQQRKHKRKMPSLFSSILIVRLMTHVSSRSHLLP